LLVEVQVAMDTMLLAVAVELVVTDALYQENPLAAVLQPNLP